MSWIANSALRLPARIGALAHLRLPLFVFVAYWVSAEIALSISPLSKEFFAPFWLSNAALFFALVYAPHRKWVCVLAAIPAHALVATQIRMSVPQLSVALLANCALSILCAETIERTIANAQPFLRLRNVVTVIVFVGFLWPAFAALGGALVPILGDGSYGRFWTYWFQWWTTNTLGVLTLGILAIVVLPEKARAFDSEGGITRLEAIILSVAIAASCEFAFHQNIDLWANEFSLVLIYAPFLLLLRVAVRFGLKGAIGAMLIMSLVMIWRFLNGDMIFLGSTREHSALASILFLIVLAIPVLMLGASVEETARSEQQLRDEEERFEFVAASVDIGLWQFNHYTKSFWTTIHCRTMFAIERVNATSSDFASRIHGEDRHLFEKILQPAVHGTSTSCEFRISLPTGETRWIRAQSCVHRGATEGTDEISGFFRDITAGKEAEAASELQARELAHLGRVSQIGELSGGLAHELTQPLTSILANAEAMKAMLMSGAPDLAAEAANILDDIISEDKRAGDVIHRLRALLKVGDGCFELVDINELLTDTLKLLRGELISHHIRTEVILLKGPVLVSGDPIQLQQVIINLVLNAIDALNNTSLIRRHIVVRTEKLNDNEIQVTVMDNGTGLGPSGQLHAFEPFYTTKEKGLGLGLAICSGIIKRHRGALTLVNNSAGGATAQFRLSLQNVMERVA